MKVDRQRNPCDCEQYSKPLLVDYIIEYGIIIPNNFRIIIIIHYDGNPYLPGSIQEQQMVLNTAHVTMIFVHVLNAHSYVM